MPTKFRKIEALRGFAAVYVVLHHTLSANLSILGIDFSLLFSFGQEAVILFFVLSGFVIQYTFNYSSDKSFKRFFQKRFLRIYIPLAIVFIAHYTILSIEAGATPTFEFWTLVGNFLMLQDISILKPNVICNPFLGNSPLWSLSYEWWFYMLFFLFIKFFKKKASIIAYTVGTIATLTYFVYPFFVNRIFLYFVIFWIGADIAKLHIQHKELTIKAMKWPIAFLTFITILFLLNLKWENIGDQFGISPFVEFRHFLFAFVFILLAIVWKHLNWVGFKNTIGLFEIFAPISFGIYISHWFLISEAQYLQQVIANEYVVYFFYTLICIIFSYLLERIIYVRIKRWFFSKHVDFSLERIN